MGTPDLGRLSQRACGLLTGPPGRLNSCVELNQSTLIIFMTMAPEQYKAAHAASAEQAAEIAAEQRTNSDKATFAGQVSAEFKKPDDSEGGTCD